MGRVGLGSFFSPVVGWVGSGHVKWTHGQLWSVCVSGDDYVRELCQNGGTDRNVVWGYTAVVGPVRPWPDHFFCHEFFQYSLPFKVIAQPRPLTTAFRHYMAGQLFRCRLRPSGSRNMARLPNTTGWAKKVGPQTHDHNSVKC